MSLTWDVSKVAESVRIGTRYDERNQPFEGLSLVTECLIWSTLMLGIGTITEKNAGEFFARIALYERLYGAFIREGIRNEDGEYTGRFADRPITEQDVIDHIGLATNASFSDEPRAKWLKRVVGEREMDDSARSVRKAQAARVAVEADPVGV